MQTLLMKLSKMTPRILPGGILVYPNRGPPPPLEKGYKRRPGDPYTLVPDVPDCPLRVSTIQLVVCNRTVSGWREVVVTTCKSGKRADPESCLDCAACGEQDQLILKHQAPAPET